MPFIVNVVINMNPGGLNVTILIAISRQALQQRLIELLKLTVARSWQLFEGAMIEIFQQTSNRLIE